MDILPLLSTQIMSTKYNKNVFIKNKVDDLYVICQHVDPLLQRLVTMQNLNLKGQDVKYFATSLPSAIAIEQSASFKASVSLRRHQSLQQHYLFKVLKQ